MSTVSVDPVECTGCELCTRLCPQVFRQDGFVATTIVDQVTDESLLKSVHEAAASCPAEAISVIDSEG